MITCALMGETNAVAVAVALRVSGSPVFRVVAMCVPVDARDVFNRDVMAI